MMVDDIELNRLFWHSRRGMLELDVLLVPFVREVFATDFSPQLLKEHAPRIFTLLGADAGKITRMPADFHALELYVIARQGETGYIIKPWVRAVY